MEAEKLQEVLRLHKLWMNGDSKGCRANLHWIDLRGADLRVADLRRADLHGANLHGANLHWIDLRGADLRVANLHGANLHWIDLRGADLRVADLRVGNLRGIDLRGANLYGARGAIVSAGPAGSERRITYYFTGHDEVQCGCFGGTLAEFEAKVETEHKEHPLWLAEYRAMIVYFKALRALEIEKTERKEEKEADDDDSDDNA